MTSRRMSFWSLAGAISKAQKQNKPAPEQFDLGVPAPQLRYSVPQEQAIAEWNRLREVKVTGVSKDVERSLKALVQATSSSDDTQCDHQISENGK